MALSKEDVLNAIADMSVMEVVELIADMEEKFGVSAAAPVAVAAPGSGWRRRGRRQRRRKDRGRRNAYCGRRQEGQRYQGCPCHHGPGLERSQSAGG